MNSQKPMSAGTKNRHNQKSGKRRAKAIIIFFVCFIVGTTVLCLALLGAMKEADDNEIEKGNTYLFYEPDYSLNILENDEYLDLDRTIRFENPDNGITNGITRENLDDIPTDLKAPVSLLCDFIDYAIHGESEMLNSLFSDAYIEAGGKTKMDFTMQQLYNIKISYVTSSSEVVEGFTEYSYDFWLEYMIHKNSGSFRNDMESDCVRKEYVRVTDRNGILGIDVLAPYNTQPKEPSRSNEKRIVIAFSVSAVIVGAACFVGYSVIKKQRR